MRRYLFPVTAGGSAFTFAAAVLANAALFVLPTAETALALPKQCRIITYYQTAEMVTVVGVRTNCPGSSNSGRTSPHKEIEVVSFDGPTTGGGGGGGGNLPCEFLASGCSNLPTNRFN
jgi:hypothetical protein